MSETIVCFGPGPQFKGGISNYNTSLAKALDKSADTDVHIVSWTQQYPAIIPREFKDLKSKGDLLEGTGIQVKYMTNYNNPFSWLSTVKYIKALKPSKVIFQWSIALQGLPLGFIAGTFLITGTSIGFFSIVLYMLILIQVLLTLYYLNYKKQTNNAKSYFENREKGSVYK